MKINLVLLTFCILAISCNKIPNKQVINKMWLDRSIDFDQISQGTNTYHMFDSSGTKVGSMIFGTAFENGKLVSRDTSKFDDGSVYEEAQFVFDTSRFSMTSERTYMQFGPTSLTVDLYLENGVSGTYEIKRDTLVKSIPIDSTLNYDVTRSELYMLMQTLTIKVGDTLNYRALIPTSMSVSAFQLTAIGEETVKVPNGEFKCDVILLTSDGQMPTNKIWISKEGTRRLIKFLVPDEKLTIELVSTR